MKEVQQHLEGQKATRAMGQSRRSRSPIVSACIAALIGASLSLGLSGCTSVLPSAVPDTYDITAPQAFPGLKGGSRAQILILEPSALKSLDSQSIVVKPEPAVVEYLGRSQWTDRLPKVVQAKLVETFENTGRVRAVAKPGEGLVIDYQIVTDIRAFQANLSGGNTAQVSLSVKLVSDRTGKVLRSEVFDVVTPITGSSNLDFVRAIDAAFDEAAIDIVRWVFARI